MANVKISNLPAASDVVSSDVLPVVDDGTTTTKKATFQQVLDYVTGSTFNDLTVTSLTASVSGTLVEATNITGSVVSASNFYGDGSGITGVSAEWDGQRDGDASITGSLVVTNDTTLGDASSDTVEFVADISSSLVPSDDDAFDIGVDGTDRWRNLYVSQTVSAGSIQTTGGNTFGDASDDIHTFTGSIEVQGAGASPAFRVKDLAGDTNLQILDSGYVAIRNPGLGGLQLSVGTAGTQFFGSDSEGVLVTSRVRMNNSAGADTPRFMRESDRDTGVGFPDSNEVSLVAGGTDQLVASTSGVEITGYVIANDALSGSIGSEISETSYNLTDADRGKTLLFSNAGTQGITCSSGLSEGFNTTFIQLGAGQLEFSGDGVTILNRQSHTKTAGQYAEAKITVLSSTTHLLSGDTST